MPVARGVLPHLPAGMGQAGSAAALARPAVPTLGAAAAGGPPAPPLQGLKWDKMAQAGLPMYAAGWGATLLILLASWTCFPPRGKRGREKEAAQGKGGAEGV